MRHIPWFFVLWLASSCTNASVENRASTTQQPIIYGSEDKENEATVYVETATGSCTGTLIAKSGSLGFVLTAGHCTDARWVAITSDIAECSTDDGACTRYEVVQAARHPSWVAHAASVDYQVLTIDNVADDTPVVPIVETTDELAIGTQVEVSGFGLTNNDAGNLVLLGKRYHATTTVHTLTPNGLEEGLAFLYLQGFAGPGGHCFGDSGGPVYVGTGANKRVVGVIAQGDDECNLYGMAARVSSATAFINAVISGSPLPAATETCNTCQMRMLYSAACATAAEDCTSSDACLSVDDCWSICDSDSCRSACLDAPQGGPLYRAILGCVCDPCASLCASCGLLPPSDAGADAAADGEADSEAEASTELDGAPPDTDKPDEGGEMNTDSGVSDGSTGPEVSASDDAVAPHESGVPDAETEASESDPDGEEGDGDCSCRTRRPHSNGGALGSVLLLGLLAGMRRFSRRTTACR